MNHQVRAVFVPSRGPHVPIEPAGAIDDDIALAADRLPSAKPASSARKRWLLAFGARLAELRPGADSREIDRVAAALWREAGSFDPVIAAEMESEAGSREAGEG